MSTTTTAHSSAKIPDDMASRPAPAVQRAAATRASSIRLGARSFS